MAEGWALHSLPGFESAPTHRVTLTSVSLHFFNCKLG